MTTCALPAGNNDPGSARVRSRALRGSRRIHYCWRRRGGASGALRTTLDLDVVYSRHPENVARLVAALKPYEPYLRGAPPGLPFRLDEQTIARGLNFALTTTLGDLDLLGDIAGGGTFADLQRSAEIVELEGFQCLLVSLPTLIALKRAAGRGKDREALAELEALLEERDRASRNE